MRIIKEGKLPSKEKEMTCYMCGCVFMYDLYSDIHSDQRDDFVICPTCKTHININGRWKA